MCPERSESAPLKETLPSPPPANWVEVGHRLSTYCAGEHSGALSLQSSHPAALTLPRAHRTRRQVEQRPMIQQHPDVTDTHSICVHLVMLAVDGR